MFKNFDIFFKLFSFGIFLFFFSLLKLINDFLLNSFNVNEEFFKMFSKLDQKEIFSFLRFNLYFLAIS